MVELDGDVSFCQGGFDLEEGFTEGIDGVWITVHHAMGGCYHVLDAQ